MLALVFGTIWFRTLPPKIVIELEEETVVERRRARKWLYCKPHWFMVPIAIRRRVWAAYNALPHGPAGNCLKVSQEWIDAVHAAEAAIKAKLAEAR